jgi:hypothetical protein
LVEGENLAVRLSATARWTEVLSIFGIFDVFGKMTFIVYGIFFLGGGIILVLIFKKEKGDSAALFR